MAETNFTDREILTDMLFDAKHLSRLAHMGVLESADEPLAREFRRIMAEQLDHHRTVFQAMSRQGWYTPLRLPGQAQEVSRELAPGTPRPRTAREQGLPGGGRPALGEEFAEETPALGRALEAPPAPRPPGPSPGRRGQRREERE